MYVIAIHQIVDPERAFERGARLQMAAEAPPGVSVLQFYPAADNSRVVCLWEGPSAQDVQQYVDSELGDASVNHCFEIGRASCRERV